MSEFYFDYKCISLGGREGKLKDKALDFYLFQDYAPAMGALCVQVYVPKEIRDKICGARIYAQTNSVVLPDFNDPSVPYEWADCRAVSDDSAVQNIGKDNCLYLLGKNGELSGSGVIAFIEGADKTAKPRTENIYTYVVNFAKKEAISYYIKEQKGKIKIKVVYPLIRKPITLGIVQKKGAKPVLIRDRTAEGARLENVKIVLSPNGRREDATPWITVTGVSEQERDFRLVFDDPHEEKYYLLTDESEDTIEDRASRKEMRRNKRKLVDRVRKCPYCGEPMGAIPDGGGTSVYTCDGKPAQGRVPLKKLDKALKGKATVICKKNMAEESVWREEGSRSRTESFLPANNLILPDGYLKMPAMNIVTVGYPKSGKTMFLSSLINMQEVGGSEGYRAEPFLLDRILNKFQKSFKPLSCEEVKYYNIEPDGKIGDKCERARLEKRGGEGIKERFILSTGARVRGFTPPKEAARLSFNPIGFKMGKLGFLYFYDVPGEVFTYSGFGKLRSIDMADCFLAVIDGDLRTAGEGKSPAQVAFQQLTSTIDFLQTLAQKPIDFGHTPIAVVFTKHDKRLSAYAEWRDKGDCFDENCHIVREDMLALMPKNGVYEGSALEKHIDFSSYEIEHFLKSVGQNGEERERLTQLMNKCKNIKFFTCSALGSEACLSETIGATETKEVLFRPRRLRLELPLVWLMYKKGLISR